MMTEIRLGAVVVRRYARTALRSWDAATGSHDRPPGVERQASPGVFLLFLFLFLAASPGLPLASSAGAPVDDHTKLPRCAPRLVSHPPPPRRYPMGVRKRECMVSTGACPRFDVPPCSSPIFDGGFFRRAELQCIPMLLLGHRTTRPAIESKRGSTLLCYRVDLRSLVPEYVSRSHGHGHLRNAVDSRGRLLPAGANNQK